MFTGYSEKTLDFLWGIRFNNNRDWFTAHKEEYLQHLYQPTVTWARRSMAALRKNSPTWG